LSIHYRKKKDLSEQKKNMRQCNENENKK